MSPDLRQPPSVGTPGFVMLESLRGETWKRVTDPCFNCQELIRDVSNFNRYGHLEWGLLLTSFLGQPRSSLLLLLPL